MKLQLPVPTYVVIGTTLFGIQFLVPAFLPHVTHEQTSALGMFCTAVAGLLNYRVDMQPGRNLSITQPEPPASPEVKQ